MSIDIAAIDELADDAPDEGEELPERSLKELER